MTTEPAAIERRKAAPLAVASDPENVMAQILGAAREGMAVESLAKLMDLYERVERRTAEKSFFRDLAGFQDECPVIEKSSTAKIATNSGSGYEFNFADYETIATRVRPTAKKFGFSWSFDASATGAMLKCTCVLRHRDGHSIPSSFELPTENKSGATPQQKQGGALTYAKRMTLVSALGLTLGEPDPDAGRVAASPPVTEEQLATLHSLVDEVKPNKKKMLGHFGIEALAEMKQSQYPEATRILEALRKRGAAQ